MFSAEVSARDINGEVLVDFGGSVPVSAWRPGVVPPLVFTEFTVAANGRVELTNPTDTIQDISGLQVVFFDSTSWPSPKTTFRFPVGTVCPPRGVLELRGSSGPSGSFPLFFIGATLTWNNDLQNNPIAVMLRRLDGSILDFVCAMDAFPFQMPELSEPEISPWVGAPIATTATGPRTYQRIGIADNNSAADWVVTNATLGSLNSELRLPMVGTPAKVSMSPGVITFTNGRWAGNLALQTGGVEVFVRADDGDGHSGQSNPFYVSPGPGLSLHLSNATHEAMPSVHVGQHVSVPFALSTNLEITLTSQLPEEVSVPARVVIPSGQTNVSFDLRNFNDSQLDGPRVVKINASAIGFTSANATVTNHDDEMASLVVWTPSTVTEGMGWLPSAGAIISSVPPAVPVALEVSSSNPSRLQVPATVYLAAGQTSTVFDVVVPDNRIYEESLSVTIRASVPGWTAGESLTLVHDNESTNLQVFVPSQFFEGSVATTNGVLRLGATLSTNLQIALASSAPESIEVPATVIVPAGQTSTVFNVTVLNDVLPQTNRIIRLTAAAAGFGNGSVDLVILDDDVGRFFLERVPDSQISGAAFPVTVYAQNVDTYTIPSFNGMASVGATGAWGDVPVEPATIGPFTNGTWSGLLRVMAESPAARLVVRHANGSIGESNPFDVAAATVTNLSVSDLVYDPLRRKLWAGLLPASGTNGSVVCIDPETGSQEFTIPLNNHPGKLAISDNGQYLYVGLNTTGGIARVNLASQTIDLRFRLGPDDPAFGTLFADDMDVVPGRPETLLVSRRVNFNAYNQGIAAYDNGVQRPEIVGPAEFGSGYRISVYDSPTNCYFAFPSGLRRLALVPAGLSIAQEFRGNQYGSDMEFDGTLSYGTSGEVFDPYRFRLVGRFGASGWVRPVPSAGRVFFLHENQLEGFDTRSYLPLGRLAISGVSGSPLNLIHAGSNRLAFATTSGQLFLLNTMMLPAASATDLSINQFVNSTAPKVGENLIYTIFVSNRGPALATNVVVGDWLAHEVVFVSVTSSAGACDLTNNVVRCAIGDLASGGSASVMLTVKPRTPGTIANIARVTGGGLGMNDDFSRRTDLAVLGTNLPPVTVLDLNVNDLAYDPTMNTLWASVSSSGGNLIPSLRAIDLGTGLEAGAVPLTRAPGQLAISSNGRYLYAGLDNGQAITRLDTVSRTLGSEIGVGGFTDMEVLPETPTAIAVSMRDGNFWRGIGVFENGVLRGTSHPDLNAAVIEFGDNNSLLYGVPHGPPGYLYRLGMTNYAISLIDVTEGLFNGWGADVKKGSNLLFAADGNVINPATVTRVGRLPIPGQVRPDSRVGLVFYLSQVEGTNWSLTAIREDTLQLAWSYPISGFRGFAGRLVRCRPGILAVHTSEGQVFILNTSVMSGGAGADLTLELVSPDGVTGDTGGHVEFTTHTENHGPAPAYGVYLTNHLSGPVELISVTTSRGTWTNSGSRIICSFGDLEPGTAVDAIVRVTGTNGGTVSNIAIVSHSGLDPAFTNNLVVTHANFLRVPIGDVTVAEIRSPSIASVGTNTAISVIVTNRGPDEVPNVILTYTVPPGVTVESAIPSQGTVTMAQPISVSFGTISNGATAELSLTIRPSHAGLLINRARLLPSRHDSASSNNEASSVISVVDDDNPGLLEQFTLPARDIVYDAARQQIFASLGPEAHSFSNMVIGLDITTGAFSNAIPVSDAPGLLAISDNGQYLYAHRRSTGGVSRVNIPANTEDLIFELWPPNGALYGNPGDMEVLPGQPDSLAVSVRSGVANVGLFVFDNGVARPNSGPGSAFQSALEIAFAGSGALYQSVPGTFRLLSVDAAGIQLVDEITNRVAGFGFDYDVGRVYLTSGRVLDPTNKVFVGQFPVVGYVAADASKSRAYFLTQGSTGATLRAFSSTTMAELWSVPLPAGSGVGTKLIKLGTNGLALTTDQGRIFVVRPTLIGPQSADLIVQQNSTPNPVTIGDVVTNMIVLQNHGRWTATGVTLTNALPVGAAFLSVTSSTGACTYAEGIVSCSFGSLLNGASVTLTTRFAPSVVGPMTNVVGVYAAEFDQNTNNNVAVVISMAEALPTPSIADITVVEGNAAHSLVFRAALSAPSSQRVTVQYQATDGTAIGGQDYSPFSSFFFFPPGIVSRTISVPGAIRGDTLVQSNRHFFLNLSATNMSPTNVQAKVTIIEDDYPMLSASNVTVVEGAAGATAAAFSITLQPPAAETVTVDYTTLPRLATIDQDFQGRSGTLVFSPGITNKVLSIPVFGDSLYEQDEDFVLLLSAPAGALLAANEGTGVILNDDVLPIPIISAFAVNAGAVALRFPTVEGRSYSVERSHNLAPASWVFVAEIAGTGSEVLVNDTVDPSEPQSFYRIVSP